MVASAVKGLVIPTYCGIMGNDLLLTSDTTGGVGVGIASSAGVLHPGSKVSFKDITDGSSNTVMVGEQSDFTSDKQDLLRSGFAGGWIGVENPNYAGIDPLYWPATGSLSYAFNLTAVRYAVNYKPDSSVAINANGLGNFGQNNPILSIHPGVAFVLFADGRSRPLNGSMNVGILKNLAAKADGNVLGEF